MTAIARNSLLLLGVLMCASSAFAYVSPGAPVGYVNDFASIIDADSATTLTNELTTFATNTGTDVVVVTVPNLGGGDIETYANTLYREWGIGSSETDRGILVLIAKEEREVRIEVGYGLEGEVPDVIANRIIHNVMVPFLADDKYGEGLLAGTRALLAEIEVVGVAEETANDASPTGEEVWYIVVLIYVGSTWVIGIMSRTKEWILGGVFGGVVSAILGILFGTTIGLAVAVPLVLIGLVIDYVVSQGYREAIQNGTTPPWWTGGTFGGGGSGGFRGGGGFGGFGGGSSGGGGASGRF